MSTRLTMSRHRGRRTKGMGSMPTQRTPKPNIRRNGSSKLSIADDLSLKEQYALIFFSRCQFPSILRKKSADKSPMQSNPMENAREYGVLNVRMRPTSENSQKIASLGRFYSMIIWLWLEKRRNIMLAESLKQSL